MLITPSSGPACDSSHFKALPLFSTDELCTRKYPDELITEVICSFRGLGGSGDQDFWRDGGIIDRGEIRRKGVRCNVCRCFILLSIDRRWAGLSGQERWVVFTRIIECPRDVFFQAFLQKRTRLKFHTKAAGMYADLFGGRVTSLQFCLC